MARNVTIQRINTTAGDDSTNGTFIGGVFTPSADNAVADIDRIELDLSSGTNVAINTSGGGGAQAGSITVAPSQTITASGASGAKTLRLNADQNITINSATTIQQSGGVPGTDKLNVVLNADSDGNGAGSILIAGTAGNITTIATSGGDVSIGGHDTTLSSAVGDAAHYATGDAESVTGAQIQFTTINSGGGNIAIAGHGFNGVGGNNRGVIIQVTSDINAAGGNITIDGVGGTGSTDSYGVALGAGTDNFVRTTGNGSIAINGTGGNGSGGSNEGVLAGSIEISTVNGAINITGVAGTSGNSVVNHGIRFGADTNVVSTGSGDITLTGTGANGGSGIAANSHAGNFGPGGTVRIGQGASGTYSGDISLNSLGGTDISLGGLGTTLVATTGTVTANAGAGAITLASGSSISGTTGVTLTADNMALTGTTAGTSVTLQTSTAGRQIDLGTDTAGKLGLTSAELNTVTASGGTLTIGRNDVGSASGDITVSAAIAPTGATTLVLKTGGAVTQSAGGTITASGGLAVDAAGSITLDTATNAVNSIAFNATGSAAYKTSTGITIATVGGVTGATATSLALTTTGAATAISQTAAIDTGTLTLATGANGQITLTNASNKIGTVQGSGTWGSGSHSIVDSAGGLNAGPITSNGDVSLTTTGGALTVLGDINVGIKALALTTSGNNIVATAAAITAATLTLETGATGGVSIQTAAHSVGTIQTTATGVGSGGLTFVQSRAAGTNVGTVKSGTAVFIKEDTGALTVSGAIETSNAAVTLTATASTLDVNAQIQTGTTGQLTLNAFGQTTISVALSNVGSLVTDAAGTTTIGGGSVTTTGVQTYHDAITLGAATNLTGTAITFDQTVDNGGFTLTMTNSGAGTFTGVISGGGGFTQAGAGTTTLAATNLYTGATTINAGTLLVNGSIAGSTTTVNSGATLGGTGIAGAVNVANGGTLSAGSSPGILTTGSLSLSSGAILKEEVGGDTAPGTGGYDQLKVQGTVSLGGATLNASLVNAFTPSGASTASLTIIDNDSTDAVTGQFAGLAEGAIVTLGSATYAISYHGGDGNDVVLLAANDAPQFTGLDNTPGYTEQGSPATLDNNATVSDPELGALNAGSGNYDGAVLTLTRNGGPNADDVFAVNGLGGVAFSGSDVLVGATVVGTLVNADGQLQITFNSNATNALVNSVLQHLTYANSSDDPPFSVQISFSLSDGNTGGQGGGPTPGIGTGIITVNITPENDRPEVANVTTNASYTIGSTGVLLSPSLAVLDVDSNGQGGLAPDAIVNAVVKIQDFALGDQLFVSLPTSGGFFIVDDGNGPVVTNISVQSNSVGQLVIAGSDTPAHYAQVLDAVQYRSTNPDPTFGGFDRNRTITWQVNDGTTANPQFDLPSSYTVDLGPTGIATADVNGDGLLDLVTSNGNDSISVLINNPNPGTTGPGQFGNATDFTIGTSPKAVLIADFDHSDTPDVVVADSQGVTIMVGNGTGAFFAPADYSVGGLAGEAIAAADFDRDGNLDLAVATSTGGVAILRGNGGGGFFAPTSVNVGANPNDIVIGDFNGDGFLDFAVTRSSQNRVVVALGTGTGSFGNIHGYSSGPAIAAGLATADLNGDGYLDIVTALVDGSAAVLLGDGTGGFGAASPFATFGSNPRDVQIADVNADGKYDVLVADSGSGDVSISFGNGDGTFTAGGNYLTGPNPVGIAVGDFNHDGSIDFATANNGAGGTVQVTLNAGTNMSNVRTTALAFNAPPALDLDGSGAGTGFTATFTEGSAAVAIADTDLSVTDTDTANAASAQIVLTNAKAGDVLSVAGVLPAGIGSTIDTSVPGQITVHLSGSAPFADYATAIGQIRFSTGSLDLGDRDITVQVSEGEGDSNVAHATIHVAPLQATGTGGDDSYTAIAGVEFINAGRGVDTITFGFKLTEATVSYSGNKVIIDGPGSHSELTGFEVFKFADGTVNNADGSPLVDDLFYYSRYHDVWNAHLDADTDYNAAGWHLGRDPSFFFSTSTYLSANPDVRAGGGNPLSHFDASGWKEGRVPSINFDPGAYLAANPDVKAAGVDPLKHYLEFGYQEGRLPIAPSHLIAANGFDYVYYLQNNPDVAASGVDPFQHFETVGWKEGRNPNALFDVNGYLNTYTDVRAAGINPLDHYNQSGWHEGRDPSVNFDTTSYLAAYADVNAAHVNPLTHFLHFGINEGRSAFPDGIWG